MQRRSFLGLTAAAALSVLTAGCGGLHSPHGNAPAPLGSGTRSGSRKKGLGQSSKTPGWERRLSELRTRWFYTWGQTRPEGTPEDVQFIPMIYRTKGDLAWLAKTAAEVKASGATELLGFNEPDAKKQGNMTVAEVLAAWPTLMDSGLRLGSPGCVHPDKVWMQEFMAEVATRKLRVDFVCVHSYGGPNADAFVKRLENVHRMFGRPLWITEFGVGDWEAKSAEENRHKPETVLRFMEQALPRLEKLDFVERYAWFPAKPTSIPLGTSALHNLDGSLTRLGECYRDL